MLSALKERKRTMRSERKRMQCPSLQLSIASMILNTFEKQAEAQHSKYFDIKFSSQIFQEL